MRRSNAEVGGLKKEQKYINKSESSLNLNGGEMDKNIMGKDF